MRVIDIQIVSGKTRERRRRMNINFWTWIQNIWGKPSRGEGGERRRAADYRFFKTFRNILGKSSRASKRRLAAEYGFLDIISGQPGGEKIRGKMQSPRPNKDLWK